jgi:hypothetical protein
MSDRDDDSLKWTRTHGESTAFFKYNTESAFTLNVICLNLYETD